MGGPDPVELLTQELMILASALDATPLDALQQLLGLRSVRRELDEDSPETRVRLALRNSLKGAVQRMQSRPEARAVAIFLGLEPGTRAATTMNRRRRAAQALEPPIHPDTFRRRYQDRLLKEVAWELLLIDSEPQGNERVDLAGWDHSVQFAAYSSYVRRAEDTAQALLSLLTAFLNRWRTKTTNEAHRLPEDPVPAPYERFIAARDALVSEFNTRLRLVAPPEVLLIANTIREYALEIGNLDGLTEADCALPAGEMWSAINNFVDEVRRIIGAPDATETWVETPDLELELP